MKVGDEVDVTIDGHRVAGAKVTEITGGLATLRIPATEVVAAVKTSLDLNVTSQGGTQHVMLGDETATPVVEVSETAVTANTADTAAAAQAAQTAPPVEQASEGIKTPNEVREAVGVEPVEKPEAPNE